MARASVCRCIGGRVAGLIVAGVAGVASVAALGLSPAGAQAQDPVWPSQTVRLVVPFPAGGSNDVMARLMAPHLEKALSQTVIVDNRPAAAG